MVFLRRSDTNCAILLPFSTWAGKGGEETANCLNGNEPTTRIGCVIYCRHESAAKPEHQLLQGLVLRHFSGGDEQVGVRGNCRQEADFEYVGVGEGQTLGVPFFDLVRRVPICSDDYTYEPVFE